MLLYCCLCTHGIRLHLYYTDRKYIYIIFSIVFNLSIETIRNLFTIHIFHFLHNIYIILYRTWIWYDIFNPTILCISCFVTVRKTPNVYLSFQFYFFSNLFLYTYKLEGTNWVCYDDRKKNLFFLLHSSTSSTLILFYFCVSTVDSIFIWFLILLIFQINNRRGLPFIWFVYNNKIGELMKTFVSGKCMWCMCYVGVLFN